MSASDYSTLLTTIKAKNAEDIRHNSNLPSITFVNDHSEVPNMGQIRNPTKREIAERNEQAAGAEMAKEQELQKRACTNMGDEYKRFERTHSPQQTEALQKKMWGSGLLDHCPESTAIPPLTMWQAVGNSKYDPGWHIF